MSAPAPDSLLSADELVRVTAVHNLGLLDTPPESRFDELTAQLAERLGTPISYLALIAEDRQWVKSAVGPLPVEAPREDAFCSRTILGSDPMVVPDATLDDRFRDSSLVRGEPHLRFYAGVPITDDTGHNVGTVCVAGPTPRELSPRELAILEGYARRLREELNRRPTVLLCYANEDKDWVTRLLATDRRLEEPGVLDLWSERRYRSAASGSWKLKEALWRARSIFMLASPAFLRSPFASDEAFRGMHRLRERDGVETTVVLVEPCEPDELAGLVSGHRSPARERAFAGASPDEVERRLRELATEIAGEPPPEKAVAAEPRFARLFLSHAGEDTPAVKELAGRLRRAGVEVWLDAEEIRPGDDWQLVVETALEASDAFAVYVGRSGIARWIGREVRAALDRNAQDPRYRFIPILGPGADPEGLPRFVSQHHWLDLRDGDPDPDEIRRLVSSILSRPPEAISLLPPGEKPFRGLLSFDVEHAHLFFGRDAEAAELLERLSSASFLAVVGDSGSGKSSLVRAGLVPALHAGRFRAAEGATAERWRVAIMKPGAEPFRELADALLDLVAEASGAERIETRRACAGELSSGDRGLCTLVAALVPKGERTLLVIDQFEEVFTQSSDTAERDRFVDTVLAASRCDGDRPLHTVVTLRADFYSRCFEHPNLPRLLATSQYALRAIEPDRLADVIRKPAALAGLQLEPGLVEAILFDLGEGPGTLPLLGHTLQQLWSRRVGETLTHTCYEEIGRVQGALEHHAEEIYSRFDARERRFAQRLLLALVVPGRDTGPARRRSKIAQLLPSGDGREVAQRVLQRLVDERLLIVRGAAGAEDKEGDEQSQEAEEREVEVAHEALLRGWNRLRGWLEEDRDYLSWRQRTDSAFEAWQSSQRDAGALLRGAPLAEAQRWLERRGEDLSVDGRTFIRESVARARRQQWIWRAAMAAIAVAGLVAMLFAVVATRARDEAETNLELAITAVDEMLSRVGSEALKDVPQFEQTRRELLDEARRLYQQLNEQRPSDARLRLQTAMAPARLAEIDRLLGHREDAVERLAAALERLASLAGVDGDLPEYRRVLAGTHNALGELLSEENPDQGALHFDQAIELQRTLAEGHPGSIPYRLDWVRTLYNRGIVRNDRLEDADGAQQDYLQAITILEPLSETSAEHASAIGQHLARVYNNLGNLLRVQGDRAGAERRYRQAAAVFLRLHEQQPMSREYRLELAKAYNNLAGLPGDARPEDALELSEKALELLERLADPLPEVRSERANALNTNGNVLQLQGQIEQAIESFEKAAAEFAALLEEYPDRPRDRYRYALVLTSLGYRHARAGRGPRVTEIRDRLAELLPLLEAEQRAQIERTSKYRRIQEAV